MNILSLCLICLLTVLGGCNKKESLPDDAHSTVAFRNAINEVDSQRNAETNALMNVKF